MEGNRPKCSMCQEDEYYEDNGFYYCKNCETQSQELREEVNEFGIFNIEAQGRRYSVQNLPKNASGKPDEGVSEWTTWELHNFVLKGMVDELIALGVDKQIKIVVLQMWATYLHIIEAAFVSKADTSCLPKLHIQYHKRDGRIIYGVEQEKKKRKSESSPASSKAPRSGSSRKKALFEAEYERSFSEMTFDAVSMLNESLMSTEPSSSPKKKKKLERACFTKEGFKAYKESIKSCRTTTYDSWKSSLLPTRKILITFLYLALLYLGEKTQLSDLLRWIEEGALSYYEVTHFFPSTQKVEGEDVKVLGRLCHRTSHLNMRVGAKSLASILDMRIITAPDFVSIARRYIEELQLPDEMLKFVETLITISSPSTEFKPSSAKYIPNYEGLVMGFIIVVLKLLMGLDEETEQRQSELAEKMNVSFHWPSSLQKKLFVWNDWVKYIECRKTVLARSRFAVHSALFQQSLCDPGAYGQFWNKMKAKDVHRKDRIIPGTNSRYSELKETVRDAMKQLQNEEDISRINFVSSLTPMKSNLEVLLGSEAESSQISAEVRTILEQDFPQATLNYLVDPYQFARMVCNIGHEISISKKTPHENINIFKIESKFSLSRPIKVFSISDKKGKTRQDQTELELLDHTNTPENLQTNTAPTRASYHNITDQRNKDSVSFPTKSTDKLFIPNSEYWVIDFSNRAMSVSDFEERVFSSFPPSFQWLLKQCANTVQMSVQELYYEVLNIELILLYVLEPVENECLSKEQKIMLTELKSRW